MSKSSNTFINNHQEDSDDEIIPKKKTIKSKPSKHVKVPEETLVKSRHEDTSSEEDNEEEQEQQTSTLLKILNKISSDTVKNYVGEITNAIIAIGGSYQEYCVFMDSHKYNRHAYEKHWLEAMKIFEKTTIGEGRTLLMSSLNEICTHAMNDSNDMQMFTYKLVLNDSNEENEFFKYYIRNKLLFSKLTESEVASYVHMQIKDTIFYHPNPYQKEKGGQLYHLNNYGYWVLADPNTIKEVIKSIMTTTITTLKCIYSSTVRVNKVISIIDSYTNANKNQVETDKSLRNIYEQLKSIANKYGNEMELLLSSYPKIVKNEDKYKSGLNKPTKIKSIYQFYPNIPDHFDTLNPNIFAFKNKVYDFGTNKIRKARPNELISKFVSYDYEDINENIKKAMLYIYNNFMLTAFNSKEEANYMLQMIARCLVDHCPDSEKFYILKGSGGNGKGVLLTLISKTLDRYYGTMPFEYFDKKKSGRTGTGTDEVLAQIIDKRLAIVSELPKDISINLTILKQISGKDTITFRQCYQSAVTKTAKTIIMFLTNHFHEFGDNEAGKEGSGITDNSVPRRMEAQILPNRFTTDPIVQTKKSNDKEDKDKESNIKPTVNNKFVKQADKSMKSNFENNPIYKIAFFHILAEAFMLLRSNKFELIPSPEGSKLKNQFLEINDKRFNEFTGTIIELFEGKHTPHEGRIRVTDIYANYIAFCKTNSKLTPLSAKVFKEKMTDQLMYEIRTYDGIDHYVNIKYVKDYKEIIKAKNIQDIDIHNNDVKIKEETNRLMINQRKDDDDDDNLYNI